MNKKETRMILLIKDAKLYVWFFYINSTYFLFLTLRKIEKINKHISEINIYILCVRDCIDFLQ